MIKEAIILAGGFGTRLQNVISDLPKPMAPVNGQPFLNYQLRYLKHYGVKKVVLAVGHLHDKITSYYKFHFEGIDIDYSVEKEALGTGGGIRLALEKCNENTVLVLNGDSFFDMDLTHFYNQHITHAGNYSLALLKVPNAARYGTIDFGKGHRIASFTEKNGNVAPGLINAGVYLLDRTSYLSQTSANTKFSIEKDFFETKLQKIEILGFEQKGYFIDIGIPEDYTKAQHDLKEFKYR